MKIQQREVQNILVTGGAGFIGSAFIRFLLAEKQAFKGICINLDALTYAGNLANLETIATDSRYRFIHGNICNQSLIEQLFIDYNIDTVIHFAAESHVDRSISQPLSFAETNILGTLSLLEAIRKYPRVHFHHVSTDEVFGALSHEGFFTEDSPYNPNSPYSASKAAADHFVRAYANTYQLSTCLSNCSNNYGPYQHPEKLIPLTILNCLHEKPVSIYGNGTNIRDWLFVEDHVEALYLLLFFGEKGSCYTIGGNTEKKNLDIVHETMFYLAKVTNKPLKDFENLIIFIKDRPGHDFRYAINASKIQREIGWTPKFSFEEGITSTIAWYLKNS